VIISLILIIGCSGGSNPVAPSGTTNSQLKSFDTFPVGVSDFDSNGKPLAGYGALGLFEIHLDAESLTGDIQSLRKASLPDVLEVVDISNFLQVAPCFDCVRLSGVEINGDGNLVATIGIRHPFEAGDTFKPISGRNRGDLHVFNVEGLVVAEAISTTSFAGIGAQVGGYKLLNADGYSPYLDGVLDDVFNTTATIHPYKLYFDDYSAGNFDAGNPMGFYSVTNPPPSGNLVMAMGCDYDYQQYEFELSAGDIDFIFAVGCTYAVSSAGKSERFMPEYRVPQHLKKAASEVNVRITDNQLSGGVPTSTADIAVDVVDRSHGVAVGTDLDEMFADSSVAGITLDIPGVLSGVATVTLTNTGGTGHDSIDPLTYEITIQNEELAVEGTYSGLVKVVDSYPSGSNASPLLNSMDGITRVGPTESPLNGLFVINEFATYQTFEIYVASGATECPDAPYAGGVFDESLTYMEYLIVGGSSDWEWYIKSDVFFDMDVLSNGEVVCVYSNDGTEPSVNLYNGSLRRADTTVERTYTIVDGDYPGYRATQIDVDSTDHVIIVTSDISHNTETTIPVSERNSQAHDYFRVVDPFVGSASEQIVNVGTRIAAVEVDENDDVWVLDVDNVMHKYIKSNGYTESASAGFNLDVTTGGVFTNDVYDFVIDFYNEAFFILTENNDVTKVNLWRIECDGQHLSDINGNPNPFMDVLGPLMQPLTNTADIAIDNLDSFGEILSGEQDSQIVVTGNYLHTIDLGGYGMVARIDSELNQHEEYLASLGFGLSCFSFDQVQNIGWGWAGESWSDLWLQHWTVPSGWQ
jgi:hypothetical protein